MQPPLENPLNHSNGHRTLLVYNEVSNWSQRVLEKSSNVIFMGERAKWT